MIPNHINQTKLPHKPGIYLFEDKESKALYVGKAVDLKSRVSSYFRGGGELDAKRAALVERIEDVQTIVVESELEALILEANLIKKYLPPFNVRLRDDKDYLYIGISKDDFPKVITLRKADLKKVKKHFGPYPSATTVRNTLRVLRRVFPWCASPPKKARLRACFYYHLGLCPGACIGLVSKKDYQNIIRRLALLLEGKKERLLNELSGEMEEYSKEERFEEAAKIKKTIDGINYITQADRTRLYLENPNFLEEERNIALKQLQKDLNLPKIPQRIEGYDISNIQGRGATGSMVVLTDGEVDKSKYRKFKIHISGRPNDVAMMREVIKRRLNHPEWKLPDLILVDGGRGQAKAAYYQLPTTNYQLPLFGLAKRTEWLYPPEGEVIKLPKNSLSLRLLQKIRDEAHRFAITYHRKLRDTMMMR